MKQSLAQSLSSISSYIEYLKRKKAIYTEYSKIYVRKTLKKSNILLNKNPTVVHMPTITLHMESKQVYGFEMKVF